MQTLKLILIAVICLSISETEAGVLSSLSDNISIGGRLQPRYEHTQNHDTLENQSSFYIRRARLDVRGSLLEDGQLTFRIMPELARTATMRDAWVNYAFAPNLQLRAGQFPLPFHWHRQVSSTRQHFAERGVPSLTLGYPSGYDIGLMLHGQNANKTLEYRIGIFDGSGRNTKLSNSDGHVVSGRFSVAPIGVLPVSEVDLYRSESPNLAFGTGLQAGNKSEVRNWDLYRSEEANRQGDFLTATADVHFTYLGFSLAADVYQRYVEPNDAHVNHYESFGYMITSGFTILPGKFEIVGRYSDMKTDTEYPETRHRQWGTGFNIYHREHNIKTRVQYLHNQEGSNTNGLINTGTLIVEHHIQF